MKKKIHMISALLAMLLPTMDALGENSDYYAALKVQVSSKSSGYGKVYASTSDTAPAQNVYVPDNMTSDTQKISAQETPTDTRDFYGFALANDGYEFAGWSKSDNGTDLGTGSPITAKLVPNSTTSPNATTYYATFVKKTLAAFSIIFETSSTGTYTVDGAAPANKTGLTEATSVVLKSTDSNFLNWKVNGTVVNDNPYTATCLTDTTISAEFLTADQVTTVTTLADLTAALSNAQYKKITIPSGTSITVAKGSTVTVPSGKQLVVDGTLNVLGTVSNSGVISGSGKLYKISYLIDQGDVITVKTADGKECGAMTCACQDSKMPRYCKTTVTQNSPSVNGTVSCMTSWGVLLNGTTAYAISKQSPKAVKVSLDTAKDSNGKQSVVNKITAVTADTDTVNENANYVLFADMTMTGPLDSSKLRSTATVDCAGKKLSAGTNSHSSFGISVLNGSFSASASQWQNAHAAFFNMSSVSLEFIKGGTSTYYYYDCGTASSPCTLSFDYYSDWRTGRDGNRLAYFYSGYYCDYEFNETDDTNWTKVYGGAYTSDPYTWLDDKDTLRVSGPETFGDRKYYIVEKVVEPAEKVVKIGAAEYATLTEAISKAQNGDTIECIAAVDLTEAEVVIPHGLIITIALNDHGISGGKIVNRGTLTFTDASTGKGKTNTDVSGGTVGSDIDNYGTLDFIFGSYSGAIVNKVDGTLTTRNGKFTGTITKEAGTVNLKGGHFSTDITSLASVNGCKVFKKNNLYSVCEVPNGTMSDATISGHAGYSVAPYLEGDYSLLDTWQDGTTARTSYSPTDWCRLAELVSFYQLFNNNGLDATLAFDRGVDPNTIRFYTISSFNMPIKTALVAGSLYRGLSEVMISYGNASKTYNAILEENIKSVSLAIADESNMKTNAGTVCLAMIELWSDDRATDYSSTGRKVTNTVYVAGQKLFTIGAGSHPTMIRPATGAATFYATLGAAMGAAADGGTVMLANDCDTALPLNKAGTYTFDTMGFAASDAVSVSDGLFVKSETAVDSSAKVLVPDAKATTYVVAQKVASVGETFYDNLTEAVGAANGATVTLLAATDETITLGEGQTFSLNKNGIAFDDAKVVTSVEGSSVKATTSEGVTVYSLVKDVVTSGEAHYPSIGAAIEAAEGNTVAVTVVAADTETIDLDAGKTLVVTVADGVEANVTVDPGEGAFIDTTTDGNTTTYESKKITVEMEEPQATVEVVKVDHGVTNAVSETSLVEAAVHALTGNHDVSRTDNTDKLDVLDKITVTPTKIVEDVTSGTMIIRSVTFDVVPHLNAGQSLAEGQKLKFRLPVDASATQLAAVVYHGDAQFGIYPVQTYNNEKFVEVESDTFSPYGYELLDGDTANPVAAIGTTGYATFAEAIEAAEECKTANGSYPVITVLDATAEQTNPDWKIADGKLVHKVYVAQVGETKYESLAAAVAAASAGDTITMLADDNVSLTNGQELEINKSLTITGPVDGDGKPLYTIYGTEDATGTNRILVDGSGTVTLSNLNIAGFGNDHATDASHAAVYVASTFTGTVNLSNLNISDFNRGGVFLYGGTFNVTDCTIDCANSRSGAFTKGIEIRNNAAGTIEDTTIVNMTSESDESVACGIEFYGNGAVTVSGCTIEGDSWRAVGIGTAGFTDTTTTGTITVEDCDITVYYAALYASALGDGLGENGTTIKVTSGDYTADNFATSALFGTIAIEGGTFTGLLCEGDAESGESGSLSISGGLFDDDVFEEYCADSYIPTVDEDTGLNTVKHGTYVAAIYDANDDLVGKYETLADAFADASEGDTVLLLTDVTEALAYGENISATLNLNGKTISVSSGYAISVTAGELTVTSVVDDDGYATGGIVGAISVSDGASLKLTGGIYDVDWDDCDIEGSIAVSSVNRFYESDPTEVEAASAVFTSPVPYEYCSTGFIPGAYGDIYLDGEFYYYVKEGTFLWKITDADGKVAYSEEVPYADDDEEYWDWDWFGEHEMNRNGFTMTLLHDVSADDDNFSAYVSGLTYTVDLGGHTVNQQMGFGVGKCDVTIVNGTVSNAGGTAISVANGAQITLGDGLVIAQSMTGVYVEGGTEEGAYSKLTVKNGAAVNGTYGVLVFGSGSSNPVTEVVVEGGTITGTKYGISGNGTIEGDTDYSNTKITISGGTVSGGEVGIYHPQAGELSVSGGTISGEMAIYARSGTIAVTGGSLNATGTGGEYNVSYAGNELQATGDALVLDAVDYPGGNPTASISGGTFVSVNGDGVASYAATGQSAESGFVSGGTFSSEVPEEYCADGYIPTDADPVTGLYTVTEGTYVAQIVRGGNVIAKYESFDAALAIAESGDTVQLLADVTGVTTTYNIDKTVTIDGQGQYAIVAGENTDPRSVVDAWGGSRVMFDMTHSTANVTFKNITLDNGEGHYYSFLARVKSGTTTFENASILHGAEADSSGAAGIGYGAAVQIDGGTVLVKGDFYADTHGEPLEDGETGDRTAGIFPFTAFLYQTGGIHFDDGVNASIGQDLLLVGMEGALDVSSPEDKALVQAMLEQMNVPADFAPYTLKVGDNSVTSFTGASPLGWNDIIDYGKDIMDVSSSLGIEMDKTTTPVEVGLLDDTVLPETFTFEDANLTVNGNGNALSGTIEYKDDAGILENIVLGTEDDPLVLDMTGLGEGNAIHLGSDISATSVIIKVTEEQATSLGHAIVTWDAAHETEEEAESLETGITVEIVDAQGEPILDPETNKPKEASVIWDLELGLAYIGPCEARLTGPTHAAPIYTTLADAIARAAQTGDTVTLLMNIANVSGTYEISKQDLVIDGAGYKVAAAPVTEHRNMFEAWSGSKNMFKVKSGDVTFRNIELDGDASHAYTFLISADNGGITLTTENVRLVNGGEQSVDSDGVTLTPGNGYGAAIHLNDGAHIVVSNGFYACSGGKTAGCFPFTAILVDEGGADVKFELTGEPNDPANVDIGDDLLLVGMLGDLISVYGIDTVQGMLNEMQVPTRFIPYTLTLADGSAYAFTGASPRRWNDIINYGKDIMDVAAANGFSGLDKDTTPVEVGLATDTILPAGADGDGYDFLYEDSNFSVNGNGNALSGTIKFTDDADGGMLADIVLGTEKNPLTLDLSETDKPVDLGDGVVIQDVVVLMTEDQATLGKVVFDWDVTDEYPPDDEQGVTVTVVNSSGEPTGEEKGLVWDEEYGVAYIGPVEARLTGTTHETPVYTSLANALDIAKDNDKVELLTNAVLSAVQGVGSDVTLDLAGYKVSVNGEKGLLVTNATLVIADTSVKTNGTICAGDEASPASLIESGNGGVVNIPIGIFVAAAGQNVLVTSDNGAFAVSGGYFSNPVLSEHCAPGYAPIEAPAGAPQQYTVGETVPEFRYPIDGTAGVPVTNTWLATYMSDIYDDPTKPIFANITNDLVQALSVDGANGIPRWESYVLGLDPTDPKAQLRLTATSKDAATVTITGLIDTTKFPEIENVAVTFRLAEQNSDKWTDVDGCTGSDVPSFTRPLEGVADKVLRIFADIEVR